MTSLLQNAVSWIGMHPSVAGVLVFVVAMAESLAMVGLVVPGAVVMIAAGALVAQGAIGFWPTLLAAVAGAIVGDGISFWIGHRYRDRLHAFWPFHRHPEWLSHGEVFFRSHGCKSILFARFVGPVRPIVPLVAGMLGMRPAAFYAVNVLSALAWAPAYLIPGMAFGASLALAGVVAVRLAMLLVLVAAMLWFIWWLIHWFFQVLPPHAARLTQWFLAWGSQHPRVDRVIGGVLDPAQPEAKALLVLGVLLIASSWLFLGVFVNVVTGDFLVRTDQALYRFIQGLRTPWGDRAMVLVTELGDGAVIALVAAAVLAWLLLRRCWRAAAYWVAAVAFGQIAAMVLKQVLQRPRPITIPYDSLSVYAFPSGHATMSAVIYGFLAVLIARNLSPSRRWLPYALAALLIGAIALSRLYLGIHRFSDVAGGLSLGLASVTLCAIAYYRHSHPLALPRGLARVALLALVLAGGWHITVRYSTDMQRYAQQVTVRHQDAASWWQEGWKLQPAYRQDLDGEPQHPLNVQWAGSLFAVSERLASQGWREPVPLSATSALRWLSPAPLLAELPVLPQVHDGRHESLILVRPLNTDLTKGEAGLDRQLVLRLWNTGMLLDPDGIPLWVGNVSFQKPGRLPFLRLPLTADGYDAPLALLEQSLNGRERRLVRRSPAPGPMEKEYRWSGNVLLVRNW